MSAGLGIIPLVDPSVSPLKGALCCLLPPLALLCLLGEVRPCVAAAGQASRASLKPCCRKHRSSAARRYKAPCRSLAGTAPKNYSKY